METVIENLVGIVGLFSIWAMLMLVIMLCSYVAALNVRAIYNARKNRHWIEQREILVSNIRNVQRWCGNDYPEVEYVLGQIIRVLRGETVYINESNCRDYLRNNFPRINSKGEQDGKKETSEN